MKTTTCLRCRATDYKPTRHFRFTGRWHHLNEHWLHLEVRVLVYFLGFIPYIETIWVDDSDFIEVNECEVQKSQERTVLPGDWNV